MNALEFIKKKDLETGEHWSDTDDGLAEAFDEYSAMKIREACVRPIVDGIYHLEWVDANHVQLTPR